MNDPIRKFMKNVKVSIITPCYNSGKTIRRTIESVLNQTFSNIEYIIVDGKSTDGTIDIIKEYDEHFCGRLKYISEKDTGIYDAMNKGLRMSTGYIIGIINSDDFYELDAVEKVVNNMTDDLYQVVYGYCNYIEKGRKTRVLTTNHNELNVKMIPHPTCFITRKTYCEYGLFLEWLKMAADYELMLRLCKKEDVHFIQVKEVLADFYVGGASTKHEVMPKLIRESLLAQCIHGAISKKEFIREYRDSFK